MEIAIPIDEKSPLIPPPPPPGTGHRLQCTSLVSSGCSKKQVFVRSVFSKNLESEFSLVRGLVDEYRYISIDTEFPGVIFRRHHRYSDPLDHYQTLKSNVDSLKLIQVGITLSDSFGNLPNLGCPDRCFIWEFNFCEFDISRDDHVTSSIELLRNQGIDFESTHKFGVSVSRFAELMMSSGLVCNENVSYITFHGGYDFGYLIKAITGIVWGLDRVAQSLDVHRAVGKSHQAGSDSLLTWHAFEKIRAVYFNNGGKEDYLLKQYAGFLYGLEVSDP